MPNRDELLDDVTQMFFRIGRQFRQIHDESLTFGQFSALIILYNLGPLPMGTVAEHLGISMASATGMIDRLVHAGWVDRSRSETDRRVVSVDLTSQGREKMAAKQRVRRRKIQELFEPLTESDLTQLLRMLEKVAERVESNH
ncbi:MAG: MarR family transcriptional regulator [Sulfobacillus benefaciens]|uniref:MarR family transcriptional regulator n=1 Tax=Sulfobacillus benefaciens TaxID=453960 RepID=A0A2T2XCB3_9FIRM|nr:MAG: MarR family transcriptional regulator [Sulfobacillus benefaciens]